MIIMPIALCWLLCLALILVHIPIGVMGQATCQPGEYRYDLANLRCMNCPVGKYSTTTNVTACTKIVDTVNEDGHFYTEDGINLSVCPDDSWIGISEPNGKCTKCPFPLLYSYCLLRGEGYDASQGRTFETCAHQCTVLSLRVDETASYIVMAVLAMFVVISFAFLYHHVQEVESKVEAGNQPALDDKVEGGETPRRPTVATMDWLQLITFVFFPAADYFTDLAFILSGSFYHWSIFALCAISFLVPNFLFIAYLRQQRILWEAKLFLPFISFVPKWVFFDEYDNIGKVLFTGTLLFPYVVMNSLLIFPKLVLGIVLYSVKVLAFARIYNMWMKLYTGSDKFQVHDGYIHTMLLNESIHMEMLVESFPQLVLQVTNGFLLNPDLGAWGGITLASVALTALNTANGLWKIVYYKCVKGISLNAIPFSVSGAFDSYQASGPNDPLPLEANIKLLSKSKSEVVPVSAAGEGGEISGQWNQDEEIKRLEKLVNNQADQIMKKDEEIARLNSKIAELSR